MPKQLAGLRWKPCWVSHMGCLAGCLEYLGLEVSRPWLYGGTGHAFALNMHEAVCPSGPTRWKTSRLTALGRNLGYETHVLGAWKGEAGFAAQQAEAWSYVRACIDRNVPCYGWELKAPEFYVIYGYDNVGYYYCGALADDGEGPKPWQDLGGSEIGVISVRGVQPVRAAPDGKTVKDALAFALRFAERPNEWTFPNYLSGPAGFALWAESLESGKADRFGQGYNGEVWRECREMAVEFLKEARARLPGKADAAFDEAVAHYTAVRDDLRAVVKLYPFKRDAGGEKVKSPEAAALVRQAGAAERKGLDSLRGIVAAL